MLSNYFRCDPIIFVIVSLLVDKWQEKARDRERYRNNSSKKLAANKLWREANAEKYLSTKKKYRADNKDKIKDSKRLFYVANKEEINANCREYYVNNCENVKVVSATWRSNNKNRHNMSNRIWAKNNTEKVAIASVRRRACEANSEGYLNFSDYFEILANQDYKCPYCNADLHNNYHLDHIMPISRGGSSWPDNFQALCPSCNLSKNAKLPWDYEKEIGFIRDPEFWNNFRLYNTPDYFLIGT